MINVACIGDNTAHGAPLITYGANMDNNGNPKIFFNNIPFTTLLSTGPVHAWGPHPLIPLINVVIVPIQDKVFINGIPVNIYGSVCSCGDIVTGSNINSKIFIKPKSSTSN